MKLETKQNDALRIVLKVNKMDKVSIPKLYERAGVVSIENRMKILMSKYFDKAYITNNPMVNRLLTEFDTFKDRNHKTPGAEDSPVIIANIMVANELNRQKKGKIKTILCDYETNITDEVTSASS